MRRPRDNARPVGVHSKDFDLLAKGVQATANTVGSLSEKIDQLSKRVFTLEHELAHLQHEQQATRQKAMGLRKKNNGRFIGYYDKLSDHMPLVLRKVTWDDSDDAK